MRLIDFVSLNSRLESNEGEEEKFTIPATCPHVQMIQGYLTHKKQRPPSRQREYLLAARPPGISGHAPHSVVQPPDQEGWGIGFRV